MGVFVTQNTPLPAPKQDLNPPQGLPTELDAADINNLWSALGDVRAHTLGWANVVEYGAKGDGITDDTAAIQAALNTGKNVHGSSGDTYLVNGGLTTSTVGQVIDFSGCTLTLKTSAASHGILTLSGTGARVTGGTWDLNSAGNATGDSFGYYAVLIGADNTTADHMYVKNSYGLGIKGAAHTNNLSATDNRLDTIQLIGIYFDADQNDLFGARIQNNNIDVSGTPGAQGIYIASASPFTFMARRWTISGNEVVGSAAATGSSVGITARGVDGEVSRNRVQGFTIGISCDIQQDSRVLVVGNFVAGANGATAYGIEVNGGHSLVSDNRVVGGNVGIIGSGQAVTGATLDGLSITGNVLTDQATRSINLQPSSGFTAQRLNIAGNTITNATAAPVSGIYLAGDCRYSHIVGNVFRGPGGAQAGSRGVYLDTVNSDISIVGNKFSGWERAAGVYNAAAVAQANMSFLANEVANDIGNAGSAVLLNLEGLATWGSGVKIQGNSRGSASSLIDDVLDRGQNILFQANNGQANPEGLLTAGIGSIYVSTVSGAIFTKIAGTGNTGWSSLMNRRVVATYGATVSIDASVGTEYVVTPTNGTAFTISNPTGGIAGRRLTIRVVNTFGTLGAITMGSVFKFPGAPTFPAPANGFSRSMDFQFDGTNWIAVRPDADVPN